MTILDDWVRDRLARHRARPKETIAPWSVSSLVTAIRHYGLDDRWMWCLTAIALLQELIFCAEGGGVRAFGTALHTDLYADVKLLRTLRNVALHPAFQIEGGQDGQDGVPMERLIAQLKTDDDLNLRDEAKKLESAWSSFPSLPMALYALRKINSAGSLLMKKHRLL